MVSQPFLRQSEQEKVEYSRLSREYDAYSEARARGEEVDPPPATDYSADIISPDLLRAVMPDATEAQLADILSTADRVYKAPTKASIRAANAGHSSEIEQGSSPEYKDTPAVGGESETEGLIVKGEPGDVEDTPVEEFSTFELPEESPFGDESGAEMINGDHGDSGGSDGQGIDFDAVFADSPAHDADLAVGLDNLGSEVPKVESFSASGVSADGKTQFAFTQTSYVSGEAAGSQPLVAARIEELGSEEDEAEDDEAEDDENGDGDDSEVSSDAGSTVAKLEAIANEFEA